VVCGAGRDLHPALLRPDSSNGGAAVRLRSDKGSAALASRPHAGGSAAEWRLHEGVNWPWLEKARRWCCTREGFRGCGPGMPG